jgi:7,8-dihydropterin-6-yl-methyl-4-(beta-D-ribofuranosyl)aminobenzene 5'-phosphate synthase
MQESVMKSRKITITILVDNQTHEGLHAEHGLAMWIEADGRRILFDTGQGAALASNAQALGVDLKDTDMLVLSHGHYDHTGGIPELLRQSGKVDVYCHSGVVQPRYAIREGRPKPIQMPTKAMAALDRLPSQRLHWIRQPTWLTEDIGITGFIPRGSNYEDTGGPFYLDPEGRYADPINDDLALWIRQDDELVVCVGCSHAGLVNTLNYIRDLNHGQRIRTVIGGFHLLDAGSERLERTISALTELEPETVIPCHCTGDNAVAMLRQTFGKAVLPGAAGMIFQF